MYKLLHKMALCVTSQVTKYARIKQKLL